MPKDVRFLSKRCYNQLIKNVLDSIDVFPLQSIVSTSGSISESACTSEKNNVLRTTCNTLDTECQVNDVIESLSESDREHSFELENALDLTNIDNALDLTNSDNVLDFTNIDNTFGKNLKEDFQTLVVEDNIAHSTVNKLLKILKKHGHSDLSTDVRVLMGSPRNASINITFLDKGHYVHFGISSGLQRSINMYSAFIKSNHLKLNINIDGLLISKSSGSQFWPILTSIEGIHVYTSPFIIGIYHGMS
ncbi:uncharacterized protein LOC113005292 isoform X1 [Solenopsis invicta]|uniref:uncharacterized protein LOC113005292 isoform X1 n=1 Tax=Solenopsis invicta TaxID=13686 RepID=UPI00193DFEB7|nr:uncharacterized protein LOC113005292 isoform X1 [Solenopsis invicta]